jgi:transcriptional regulator with XRE-family HTH domain
VSPSIVNDDLKDFKVTIRLHNNHVKSRRLQMGYSARALAETLGVSYSFYSSIETMRWSPVSKRPSRDGFWKPVAQRLAAFFGVHPSVIFPLGVLAVQEPAVTAEMNFQEIVPLLGQDLELLGILPRAAQDPEEAVSCSERPSRIEEALSCLTPRERFVISRRFGLGDEEERTLLAVGKELSIGREGARQVVSKALRKMREHHNALPLIDVMDDRARERWDRVEQYYFDSALQRASGTAESSATLPSTPVAPDTCQEGMWRVCRTCGPTRLVGYAERAIRYAQDRGETRCRCGQETQVFLDGRFLGRRA